MIIIINSCKMATKSSIFPTSSICQGCLSVDRKLTAVSDGDSAKFFGDILDPLDRINCPILLCWECSSLMRRLIVFKEQIKQAHKSLVKYMLNNTSNLPVLSKLTKTTVRHQHDKTFIYMETTDLQKDHHHLGVVSRLLPRMARDLQEDLASNNTVVNNEYNIKGVDLSLSNTEVSDTDAVDEKTVRRSKRKSQKTPKIDSKDTKTDSNSNDKLGKDQMLFVKIEDAGTCDDSDGFHGDDIRLEDGDQELKADLAPKQPKSKAEKLTKVKTKRKTKAKAKTEEFDESDEEPLKNKKQKDTEDKVKKKRRSKKEADAGSARPRRPAALGLPPGNVEMVILTWEQVEAEREKARESEAYTRHEFRCERCVVGFNHRAKLTAHMRKHEPSSGSAVCTVCTVACRNAHALAAHLRRHRARWRCVFCSSLWSRAAVAADHAARLHRAPAAVHRCRCGHQESSLGKLRNHMKNHTERQKCELCEKTFRDRASLKTHMFIHSGEKEHACPVCDKKFLFKRAMQVHAITHNASQLLYCHQCDMNFKNRMSFYQHMKYNLKHIDPAKLKHTCPICDKRFAKATRLAEHNVAVHLREAPIRCTVPGCRFACASKPVLRTHTRMAHRGAKEKRNHVCHHCGKAYTTKKSLEGHLRSHTGERPFRCGACGARFGYHAALYNHTRLVHRERKTNRNRPAPRSAPLAPPESAADSTAAGPPLSAPPGPAGPPTEPPGGPPAQTPTLLWNLNLTEVCHTQGSE